MLIFSLGNKHKSSTNNTSIGKKQLSPSYK